MLLAQNVEDAWEGLIRCHGGARALYAFRTLPQGAPTSPGVANLCAYRVDCRLPDWRMRLATLHAMRMTRVFRGREFARGVERFALRARAILLERDSRFNHRKTRLMRQGVRQYLAGLVTNGAHQCVRADFDRLKRF